MLKLIYYQFSYNKKEWLGTLPTFFIASLVTGISLNGIFNIMNNSVALKDAVDPTPIFIMPIFFGGLTLFLIISGIIKFLISHFKNDYELWTTLGANRSQLALIIGGQLFIIASISGTFGAILSVFLQEKYYHFLQNIVGRRMLPDIHFQFSPIAFLLSVLIVATVSALSGFFYARKIFKGNQAQKLKHKKTSLIKKILLLTTGFIWLALFVCILIPLKNENPILLKSSFLLSLMLVQIVLINLLSPNLLRRLVLFFYRLPLRFGYGSITAKWKVLENEAHLKSLVTSVISGISLISDFQLMSDYLFSRFQQNSDSELQVSLILYLGAPLLIILANVLSLTIISSSQEKNDIQQMSILGFSRKNILFEKMLESLIYSILVFFISLVLNLIIMTGIIATLDYQSSDDLTKGQGILTWNISFSLILFLFSLITKGYFVRKIKRID